MIADPDKQTASFLRKVRSGIASLPSADQEEIIAELRSHLSARQVQGVENPLAGFEAPEILAAEFVAEHSLRDALAQGTPWALGKALLIAGRDSALALLILLPLLLLQLSAFFVVFTALAKPFLPQQMGLWVGGGNFYVGSNRGNPVVHEGLGWWGIPILFVAGVLMFWVSNRLMMALVRRRLRNNDRTA